MAMALSVGCWGVASVWCWVPRATGSGDGGRHAGNEGKCEGRYFMPGCAAARRFAVEPKMDARSKKTDSWILDFGSHCFLEPTAQD